MKIGILGTGMVGRAHAQKLFELNYEIMIGTHNPEEKLLSDKENDELFMLWHHQHKSIDVVPFAQAAGMNDIIFNAIKGEAALETLQPLQNELKGKILVDIANPLDFSEGRPPFLSVSNTNSLGEEIQKALPDTKVVKAFSTLTADLQVNPQQLENGDHHLFICGNDIEAKDQVMEIARNYGWKNFLDLGDITNSRGIEMLLPLWLRLFKKLQTPLFNFKVVNHTA